jgi:hypothetical protein
MTKLKFILISLSLLMLLTNYSFGQGCSDAGFCTINSFKPISADSAEAMNNQFKIGAFFGSADNSIAVYGNYLEYDRQLNEKFGIDLKLTTLAQNGIGFSVFGLSDVFLSANCRVGEKLKITLGAKIPLSSAGKSFNRLPLPMDFQTSLGTYDLIFGVGYEMKKLQIVAAVQQPLTQNDNRFFASSYPAGSKFSAFHSTNKFRRSGDVLLRVSYPVSLDQKLKLTLGILPIYHLSNDKYTDEFNIEKEIDGSSGLTLNGTVYLDYEINRKNMIQINMGMPFVVRESRPDGLTRSFIANIEYRIKF